MLHDARRDAIASRKSSPRLGFPRAARLLRRAEFEAVYQGGHRRSSRQFLIFFRRNAAGRSRFGISVKKALGGAVVRNRIRRRVREILRLHCQEAASGWDVVIHPRASVAMAEFGPLVTELTGLLRFALGTPRESGSTRD